MILDLIMKPFLILSHHFLQEVLQSDGTPDRNVLTENDWISLINIYH